MQEKIANRIEFEPFAWILGSKVWHKAPVPYPPRLTSRLISRAFPVPANRCTHLATERNGWPRLAKRVYAVAPRLHGLERAQTSLLLPVAGGVFFLDSPLYRTGKPSSWASSEKLQLANANGNWIGTDASSMGPVPSLPARR